MIIAIDGPSGAGKSTVSKSVAKALGFNCLDTGAMYRSIAWYALEHGVSLEDSAALGEIARERAISFSHEPGNPAPKQVFIDGIDVTGDIRTARRENKIARYKKYPPGMADISLPRDAAAVFCYNLKEIYWDGRRKKQEQGE